MMNSTHKGNRPDVDKLQASNTACNAEKNLVGNHLSDDRLIGYLHHLRFLRDNLSEAIPAGQMAIIAARIEDAERINDIRSRLTENTSVITPAERL